MKLSEIFTQLSVGELSQMSIGDGPQGTIQPENYGKIIPHVNLGLSALYSRFNLKIGQLVLALQPGVTDYRLTGQFAVAARTSREPVRYIQDSLLSPFEDDVLKVERVLTTSGTELSLNDWTSVYGCNTPSSKLLQVPLDIVDQAVDLPDELKTDRLKVTYRAGHPQIVMGLGNFDPARVEVQLPGTHLEPLLFFIASRLNNPIGMTNEFHAGNSYAAKYEAACQRLENRGLEVSTNSPSDRLRRNGWV
jgi:hypothetical protein